MNVPSSGRVRSFLVAVVVLVGLVLLAIGIRLAIRGERNPSTRPDVAAVTHFADDFSSRSGWAAFTGRTAELSYSEGGYRLKLDRPADDGLSILVLPGKPLASVAATTVVVERGELGGLVGVGCAAGKERAYLGAVDPAGGGFVILRADETEMTLLRYGLNEEGTIRRAGEENELQVQCTVHSGPDRRTSIRLFANGRLLGAYEDPRGLGPFKGVALGGVSLRRPLDAVFERVALQTLPSPDRAAPVATPCDRLTAVTSAETDYGWLVDSGGTSLNSPDFDTRQVVRIARELRRLSTDLQNDARALGATKARRAVERLAGRLRAQGDSLNALTNTLNRGPVDTTGPSASLSCRTPRFLTPPYRGSPQSTGVPPHPNVARTTSRGRALDRRLIGDLPAPDFIGDDTPPVEPDVHVDVDLTYRSFRVFGANLAELERSLRVHAIRVEGEHAAGVTDSRFEWTYQQVNRADGCTLVPGVTLTLRITLPDWKRPAGADRYLRNQWNQFMWDLDDHERHHAELWIKAANRMIVAINGVPPGPSCSEVVAAAKARVAQVFRTYDRRQRAFDRDVAAGRLPGPSLP